MFDEMRDMLTNIFWQTNRSKYDPRKTIRAHQYRQKGPSGCAAIFLGVYQRSSMDLISPDKYVALRVLFVAKIWATASSMRNLFLDCMPSHFYLRVEHVSRSPLYSLFSRLRSTPRLCAFENLCFARSCLFSARIRTGSRHRETRIQILFISEKSFSRSRFPFLNYFQCLKFPFMNLTFSNRQPRNIDWIDMRRQRPRSRISTDIHFHIQFFSFTRA